MVRALTELLLSPREASLETLVLDEEWILALAATLAHAVENASVSELAPPAEVRGVQPLLPEVSAPFSRGHRPRGRAA